MAEKIYKVKGSDPRGPAEIAASMVTRALKGEKVRQWDNTSAESYQKRQAARAKLRPKTPGGR